jgi:O-antigen/teichoic acid export membrane protein
MAGRSLSSRITSVWPSSLDARPFASTAAANGALAVVGLLTGMLAARLLGAEGRGQLAAAQAWPLLLATLGSFGVTEAIAYFVARSPLRARAALATGLVVTVPFVVIACLAGMWLLPRLLRGQAIDVQQVAMMSLALVPLLTFSAAPAQALRGVGRYQAWNLLRLIAPLAWLATLVAVRGTADATVPTLAMAFIGTTAMAGLVTHLCAWRMLAGPAVPERSLVRPMLAYSAPTMAAAVPHWLNLRLDQLIVIALLDARAVGLYVVAVAWSGAAHPLAEVVAHNAVPMLAGTKNISQRSRLVYRTGAAAAIGTSVLLLIATPTLLPLIFGAEFRDAIPVALVMVLAGAVEATNAVGAECLRGVGRPRAILLAECIGLAVTAAALPVLVPLGGIIGAAFASLLSYSAILVAQLRLMRAVREDVPLEFAGIPPKLDPVA